LPYSNFLKIRLRLEQTRTQTPRPIGLQEFQ
jgi:hypothetical protein